MTGYYFVRQRNEGLVWGTPDTRIFSPLLYQLSYLAVCEPRIRQARDKVVNQPLTINQLR
jgi:hypothetical protein